MIAGIEEQHGHGWNAFAKEMQDGHIFGLKAAGQAGAAALTGGEHRVEVLFRSEILDCVGDVVYVHLIRPLLNLSRFIYKLQRLGKREDLLDGLFLVETEFWCASNVQNTIAEFQRDSVFCFLRKSDTGIEDDDPGRHCHVNHQVQSIAGEFGTAKVQDLEAEIEEETLDPLCKRRTAFE